MGLLVDEMLKRGAARDPDAVLPDGASDVEGFASFLRADRKAFQAKAPRALLEGVLTGRWDYHARTPQRAPEGDWRTWMIMAGRGFGKTRAGAEWVMERVRDHADTPIRIALVAGSQHEGRAVMVEGESGLLSIAHLGGAYEYQSSNRRIVWKSGPQALLYSAGEPDSLRGPQHHFAWCDEIAKWPRGIESWRNLAMGLRLGTHPRTVVTTTPRPVPLVRALIDMPGVTVTRGRTADNRTNLAASFLGDLQRQYGGTAIGRQELDGELIEEIEGALWSRALLDRRRVRGAPAPVRTVIGVDPPAGIGGDACGIVVVALGADGAAYVLADASVEGASPEGWARAVADAAGAWAADRIVAEANNGGAMVESVLRAADRHLPITLVHASRGKTARAEPVAALYEAGRAAHVGAFPDLEDELCGMILGGGYEGPGRSPDRADACVWAMHALMLGRRSAAPGVRVL